MELMLKFVRKLAKKICLFLEKESKELAVFRKSFMRVKEVILAQD